MAPPIHNHHTPAPNAHAKRSQSARRCWASNARPRGSFHAQQNFFDGTSKQSHRNFKKITASAAIISNQAKRSAMKRWYRICRPLHGQACARCHHHMWRSNAGDRSACRPNRFLQFIAAPIYFMCSNKILCRIYVRPVPMERDTTKYFPSQDGTTNKIRILITHRRNVCTK